MSISSFHQHSRAVTSISPLQFQKQLRLIEARRMMASEGVAISNAAHAVDMKVSRNSRANMVGYSVHRRQRMFGRALGKPGRRLTGQHITRPKWHQRCKP
jgi:methylphosphotriester-DNA--protein-cysteine methyltransferase